MYIYRSLTCELGHHKIHSPPTFHTNQTESLISYMPAPAPLLQGERHPAAARPAFPSHHLLHHHHLTSSSAFAYRSTHPASTPECTPISAARRKPCIQTS